MKSAAFGSSVILGELAMATMWLPDDATFAVDLVKAKHVDPT